MVKQSGWWPAGNQGEVELLVYGGRRLRTALGLRESAAVGTSEGNVGRCLQSASHSQQLVSDLGAVTTVTALGQELVGHHCREEQCLKPGPGQPLAASHGVHLHHIPTVAEGRQLNCIP